MSKNIAQKRKQFFPINDSFREYLSVHGRYVELPVIYEDLLAYASLLSNLQIKYDDDFDSPISRRNIKNINNAINKFDINPLLRYKVKDKKME